MFKFSVGMTVVAGVALLSACAMQVPPSDPVYQRIGELQHQINKLKKQSSGQQMLGVMSDQQRLHQQLTALRGKIQTLQHRLHQTRQRQQAINRNFDRRLTRLEGGNVAKAGSVPSGTVAGAPMPTSSNGPVGSSQKNSGNNAGAGQTVSDHTAYRAAFEKLRAGHNAAAVDAFKAFIKDYPNSPLVPNAWYWMAETHYVEGEYKKAINAFHKVLSGYPNSAKAPDSLLKIGYARYALGDYDKAKGIFKSVLQKYPNTTSADLARKRLQDMGVQG